MNLSAGQQWRCRQRTDLWSQWEKEREGRTERVTLKHVPYIHYHDEAESKLTVFYGTWLHKSMVSGGKTRLEMS